ncbi:hypothetical protein Pint_06100 [Pistacia integerrima]|uniref:Uncharacterized protein n=1 Tax=Pistacia integerrima TaxID=434235 RepID=A0ACC0Z4L8_9ROSI|nr:hypothetical protein Pint_06100 [Pistacia integerrima]
MVAKEFNDVLKVEDDEAEETLSLCDLVINSNTEDYNCKDDEFSIEDRQELSSSSEDFFEFSSEEYFTSSTNNYPTDDIIFCGKRIPHKQNHVAEQTRLINDTVLKQQKLLHKKSSIINYKPLPCGKSMCCNNVSIQQQQWGRSNE